MVLPKGAKVISIGLKGDVTATSNCPAVQTAIDNAETYGCYTFGVGCDDDNNSSHVMDEGSALIKRIYVGGQMYEFTTNNGIVIDWLEDQAYGISEISSKVPKELMEVYEIFFDQWSKREEYLVKVRMLPSIAKSAEFFVTGTGFINGLWVKAVATDCPPGG